LLVDRLITILNVALEAENDWSGLAFSAYATVLEASLHSRRIWEAFIRRADVTALHQVLLLTDPRKHLREQIVQSMASICRGHLPDTSPLTKEETASSFWIIISAILPEAVRYPSQSEQLFDIAEQVFRSHDEDSRDEESLRSSLVSWSDLLLNYTHEEFVGRDETDFVVLGFTKLLLCCIPSLKSFKKPLHTGLLMEQIFHKFLFIPKISEVEDDAPQQMGLPVLESKTRKELYDLMLALAEDRNSYDMLLELAATLKEEQEDFVHKSFQIERSNEIRSSTGYVGLYNPRAICYMNSLVTQLFMNVNFRKFMLGLNVADAGASQRLLAETQKLFAQLQNTYRKSADPRDFASCAKSLEGTPIDINIQMDADEFYNLLFDQWEGQMLSPEVKETFRSFYGGRTVNQIKSRECEHVSERVESFFVVQCDVQGKTSLQESLQAFVEGDVMEGDNKYKCESCGGKFVDAVKR
jgi:ubiquitin carboxyl-terminal hydrolase 34